MAAPDRCRPPNTRHATRRSRFRQEGMGTMGRLAVGCEKRDRPGSQPRATCPAEQKDFLQQEGQATAASARRLTQPMPPWLPSRGSKRRNRFVTTSPSLIRPLADLGRRAKVFRRAPTHLASWKAPLRTTLRPPSRRSRSQEFGLGRECRPGQRAGRMARLRWGVRDRTAAASGMAGISTRQDAAAFRIGRRILP